MKILAFILVIGCIITACSNDHLKTEVSTTPSTENTISTKTLQFILKK